VLLHPGFFTVSPQQEVTSRLVGESVDHYEVADITLQGPISDQHGKERSAGKRKVSFSLSSQINDLRCKSLIWAPLTGGVDDYL